MTISPRAVYLLADDRWGRWRARMLLVGEVRAEDHHDTEVQDEQGRRMAGLSRLQELIGEYLTDEDVNPVARYRERHGNSGVKSVRGDAHVLAELAPPGPGPTPVEG